MVDGAAWLARSFEHGRRSPRVTAGPGRMDGLVAHPPCSVPRERARAHRVCLAALTVLYRHSCHLDSLPLLLAPICRRRRKRRSRPAHADLALPSKTAVRPTNVAHPTLWPSHISRRNQCIHALPTCTLLSQGTACQLAANRPHLHAYGRTRAASAVSWSQSGLHKHSCVGIQKSCMAESRVPQYTSLLDTPIAHLGVSNAYGNVGKGAVNKDGCL